MHQGIMQMSLAIGSFEIETVIGEVTVPDT